MGYNDTEPQRAGPETAEDIWDSFQSVLDALDAARADLYAFDVRQGWAERPPPSWRQRNQSAGNADFTQATASPISRTPPVGRGPEGLGRPHAVEPTVVEPPRDGGVRPAGAPRNVVVEPLWSRGSQLETVPPPSVGRPPTANGAGPTHAAPPVTVPPPAPSQPAAARRGAGPRPDTTPPATPQRPARPSQASPPPRPVRAHARKNSRGWRRFTSRRDTRLAGVFGLGAVSGLLLASSLLAGDDAPAATPPASSEQPDRPLLDDPARPLPEIPGTGVLRQGDSGHGVYELQVRLLQVPNVYDGGAIDGRYDAEVRAAVARFQKWYGIRGDETGVYGDYTRRALMLRTK